MLEGYLRGLDADMLDTPACRSSSGMRSHTVPLRGSPDGDLGNVAVTRYSEGKTRGGAAWCGCDATEVAGTCVHKAMQKGGWVRSAGAGGEHRPLHGTWVQHDLASSAFIRVRIPKGAGRFPQQS